jgi:2-polyprenyl-3-methyl-5-hydroxy-6-metoxy-1,4-benzoquinol methylase
MKKDKKLITKDEYLLRNFSKIRHKKWELFVISRILHNLNDSNIEYVCQQYINPI